MIFKEPHEYKPGDILISHTEIDRQIHHIAAQISHEYKEKKLLVIAVMKGSFMVLADLIRALHTAGLHDLTVSAVTVGSYGGDTVSNKKPKFKHEVDIDVKDRHILLVEDIIDTGHTIQFVKETLTEKGAASIKCFSLLSKPSRREVPVEAEYVGFVIPNVWVQGYGLDTDEWGRGNPEVIVGPIRPAGE